MGKIEERVFGSSPKSSRLVLWFDEICDDAFAVHKRVGG